MKKTFLFLVLMLATIARGQGTPLIPAERTAEGFFRTDSAVIRGRIVGYGAEMGFSTLATEIPDLMRGGQPTMITLGIGADGRFLRTVLLRHPVLNFLSTTHASMGRRPVPFYLCPGDTLDITLTPREDGGFTCRYSGGHARSVERLLQHPMLVRTQGQSFMQLDETQAELEALRHTGRALLGQDHDALLLQVAMLRLLSDEDYGEWAEADRHIDEWLAEADADERRELSALYRPATENFEATLPYLQHPVLRQRARQRFDEETRASQTMSLPSGEGSDLIRHILAQHPGKVVLLDFWAMWCAPCKADIQATQALRRRLHDECPELSLVFLAHEPKPDRPSYVDFVRTYLSDEEVIPISDDQLHLLMDLFQFSALPFAATLTPDGRLLRQSLLLSPELTAEALRRQVREVIGEE